MLNRILRIANMLNQIRTLSHQGGQLDEIEIVITVPLNPDYSLNPEKPTGIACACAVRFGTGEFDNGERRYEKVKRFHKDFDLDAFLKEWETATRTELDRLNHMNQFEVGHRVRVTAGDHIGAIGTVTQRSLPFLLVQIDGHDHQIALRHNQLELID